MITKLTENKKDKSITNLKSANSIKLLTLFGDDKTITSKAKLDNLEININNGNFNENRINKNIKLTTNQETIFQSFDIGANAINSPINKKIKNEKIKLNTVDPESSQQMKSQNQSQNQNQMIEEDEKENDVNGKDANVIRTKKIVIRKLHLGD